jgi:hypothetical protein
MGRGDGLMEWLARGSESVMAVALASPAGAKVTAGPSAGDEEQASHRSSRSSDSDGEPTCLFERRLSVQRSRIVGQQGRLSELGPEPVQDRSAADRRGLTHQGALRAVATLEVIPVSNNSVAPDPSDGSGASASSATASAPATMTVPQDRPRSRRRFRRRWLALLVALLAIVAIVAVEVPPWLFPASSAPSQTIWQAITAGISDGTVPKQTALEAFAYLYEVDIPGVTVPKGIEGGDEPTDGTGAMSWVRANWSGLTGDRQAVINRYLNPGPADQTIVIMPSVSPTETATPSASPSPTASPSRTPSPTETATPAASASASASPSPSAASGGAASSSASPTAFGAALRPQFQLDAARNLQPVPVQPAANPPADLVTAMTNEVLADIAHLGPKLGMPALTEGNPFYPNIELILSNTDGGTTLFQTSAIESALHYEPCHIVAFKNSWSGETVTGGSVSPRLHVLLTHEVLHCYQNVVFGSVATSLAIPPWMTEGTALYLAADDTKVAESMLPSMWQKGYFTPEIALTNRSYDAYGYFALLAHEGRDLWSLTYPAWKAATASTTRSDAFIAVLTGDAPDIRNNWAESYLRDDAWGDPWIAYGFGLPAAAQVIQHPAQAQPAPGWKGSLDGRSNTVLNVDSTNGEIVTVSTNGLASVHDNNGHSALAFTTASFCTAGTCVCPVGTKLAGQNMAPDPMTIPFVAAFNAPEGGSQYNVVSEKLSDLCGQASPPPTNSVAVPPPAKVVDNAPCGSGCSQSNGDPHLISVNHVKYDFQAAGEFTLLSSPDGSLDIQARQEPFGTTGDVATNTAIAARVGSHRVGVYVEPNGSLQARVDGNAVDLSSGPTALGNGASISSYDTLSSTGFEIDFPDGTKLWTLSVAEWGIDAEVEPSAALKADGVGLLGSILPNGFGIPALPDGTQLPSATDPTQEYQLYTQFAEAWRVTDTTTLFDYDPGKSTASYTIKPFPTQAKFLTLARLSSAQLAAGNSACLAITDSGLHEECVYDVGATGQSGFADSYKNVQTFNTTAPATSGNLPATVTGAAIVAHGTAIGGIAVGPDKTVYLTVQTGDNAYSLISFDPTSGQVIRQVSIASDTEVHYAAGSLWLPGLEADANGGDCTVSRFDAGTLAKQATITVPCPYVGGPLIGSDGSAIWFMDVTNFDSTTGKGAVLTKIDPATNRPGASVPLSSTNGYLIDSQGALFYVDQNNDYYGLPTGATALALIGNFSQTTVPGGAGLWITSADGDSVQHYTAAGSAQASVKIAGTLVAGDGSAAYMEVEAQAADGSTRIQLERYPADGSSPSELALPPVIGGSPASYQNHPAATAPGGGVLKLWVVEGDTAQNSQILLQWVPLY